MTCDTDRAKEYMPTGPVATSIGTMARELHQALERIRELEGRVATLEAENAELRKEQPK